MYLKYILNTQWRNHREPWTEYLLQTEQSGQKVGGKEKNVEKRNNLGKFYPIAPDLAGAMRKFFLITPLRIGYATASYDHDFKNDGYFLLMLSVKSWSNACIASPKIDQNTFSFHGRRLLSHTWT